MTGAIEVLVLSPHRDDAAFSCGLLLTALLTCGLRATITNVFTTSDYAPYLAPDNRKRSDQVTSERAAEDMRFAARLVEQSAASINQLCFADLDWSDAPIRRQIPNESVLLSAPEETEVMSLAKQLSAGDSTALVLAPMALGDHVDHRIVRDAAARVFPPSHLLFYEDLPYACWMTGEELLAKRAQQQSEARVEWLSPTIAADGTKRAYALCYPTQISSAVADEMEVYAQRLKGRERLFGDPEAVRNISMLLERKGVAV